MAAAVKTIINFDFPFPHGLSPDHASATAECARWAREMGLVTSEFAMERLCQWNIGRMLGNCVPTARGEDLDVITKWNAWGFLYDDQFNGPLGARLDLAARVTEGMIATLYGEKDTHSHSAERALTDILQQLALRRSRMWMARFRNHNQQFLVSLLRETAFRMDGSPLGYRQALELRRGAVAMEPLVDLIEVAENSEVPGSLIATPQLQEMRRIVGDLAIYQNDFFSLPKDRRQLEVNTILALEQEGLTEQQALARIEAISKEEVARFLQAKEQLPSLCGELGLTSHDVAQLDRHVHCMELMIHGILYVHKESLRYADHEAHTAPLAGTGYLEDLGMDSTVTLSADIFRTAETRTGQRRSVG
ncbi:hypothetical protein BBK14_19495 [Parafrankia soli]|uniref:Uncharacterized protein n=1 Tax=Parafrankia soli TaxID=2599596 RepID=A0A1S1PYE1_9ACTN|nr:hypothetical protein [Parafrankia soli]OHV27678.1 hypothetical protein BBK14_19495 [Parafrankia soli]